MAKFKSGDEWKGNAKGRPISTERLELRAALDKATKEYNKTFLEHFVQRAYEDNQCAIALAKKLLPDLTEDKSMQEVVRTFLVRCSDDKKITNKIIFEKQTLASELPEYNK